MQRAFPDYMERPEARLWILRQLGSPVVPVHLTECQLDDAFDWAYRWLSANLGFYKQANLTLIPGQPDYDVVSDCDTVTDVAWEESPTGLAAFIDPSLFPTGSYPAGALAYGPLLAPASGGLYSSFQQSLQVTETAQKILSIDDDWEMIGGKLFIYPTPKQARRVIYTYKSKDFDLRKLTQRQYLLYLRYALAKAKETLGNIYLRFPGGFPSAQGMTELGGDTLLQQAQSELEELASDVANERLPMPILTG